MKAEDLQKHIFATYLHLRSGMAVLAILLPVVVYAVGLLHQIGLQDSLSAYYWAPDPPECPVRIYFVALLFAIAAFLYLYKGFTYAENIALNLAALFAVGVALVPMAWRADTSPAFSWHGFFAISLFVCLFYVVWFRARDTLKFLPADSSGGEAWYARTYKIVAVVMLASPLTAWVASSFFGAKTAYVFFIETLGIWAFSAYWLVKSAELKRSGAIEQAARGQISVPEPKHDIKPAIQRMRNSLRVKGRRGQSQT